MLFFIILAKATTVIHFITIFDYKSYQKLIRGSIFQIPRWFSGFWDEIVILRFLDFQKNECFGKTESKNWLKFVYNV